MKNSNIVFSHSITNYYITIILTSWINNLIGTKYGFDLNFFLTVLKEKYNWFILLLHL